MEYTAHEKARRSFREGLEEGHCKNRRVILEPSSVAASVPNLHTDTRSITLHACMLDHYRASNIRHSDW